MNEELDLYAVMVERDTGFWVNLPVRTGRTVSREEWLSFQQQDPDHFQIIEFTPDGKLPLQSTTMEDIVEHALAVTWIDEMLH